MTALALVVFVLVVGLPVAGGRVRGRGGAAVIFLHRHNIRRLLGGTEHRFELRQAQGARLSKRHRRAPTQSVRTAWISPTSMAARSSESVVPGRSAKKYGPSSES